MDIKRKGRVSGVSQVAMVKNVRKGKLYLWKFNILMMTMKAKKTKKNQ